LSNREEFLGRIREMVARSVEESKAREDEERAAGKILVDNPVARQMARCGLYSQPIPPGSEHLEVIQEEQSITFTPPGMASESKLLLITGTTSYLTARRQWKAYRTALRMLPWGSGVESEDPFYEIFHYVPGVMVFLTSGGAILACVRSRQLAGTHVGTVSFPAGLMRPGEELFEVANRQLFDETGLRGVCNCEKRIAMATNPEAPQTTYCFRWQTGESSVRETFEAEGKTFIWVPVHDCLEPAIAGDMGPMIKVFRNKGIDVPDTLQIAPDALEGLRGWGFGR